MASTCSGVSVSASSSGAAGVAISAARAPIGVPRQSASSAEQASRRQKPLVIIVSSLGLFA
jgi:hypothetical protein